MSFNHTTTWSNIWTQVKWKCASCSTAFLTLLVVQIVICILTSDGTSSFSTGGTVIKMQIQYYSLDGLLMFSMLAVFILSSMLASKQMMNENFSAVTNRFTASISTIIVLVFLCFVGTLMAVSSFYISTYFILIIREGDSFISETMLSFAPIFIFFTFLVLSSGVGFFIGSFLNLSKWIAGIGAILTIISIQVASLYLFTPTGKDMAEIILPNYYVIGLQLLGVAVLLYGLGTLLRNRSEVSR